LHILNLQHQNGPVQDTMVLITPAYKNARMKCLESYNIQIYQQRGLWTDEHNVSELNPIYEIAHDT
jgi:hypothetical protein